MNQIKPPANLTQTYQAHPDGFVVSRNVAYAWESVYIGC